MSAALALDWYEAGQTALLILAPAAGIACALAVVALVDFVGDCLGWRRP